MASLGDFEPLRGEYCPRHQCIASVIRDAAVALAPVVGGAMRLAVLAYGLTLSGCEAPQSSAPVKTETPVTIEALTRPEQPSATEWRITSIDWDDADSGDINGVRFRLHNVDAPETGGVGARIGAAECQVERARGIASREWIEDLTRDPSTLRITATHGYDRMDDPRLLINLSVNGQDVGQAGIDADHLKPWPHDGARQLVEKTRLVRLIARLAQPAFH